MHVALAVRSPAFPIDEFLNARGRSNVTINTAAQAGKHDVSTLTFHSDPNRRGGEWRITDQFSHRHPAWSRVAGFPTAYDHANPPYVLLFRVGNTYHVRFTTPRQLSTLQQSAIPEGILSEVRGIGPAPTSLLGIFGIAPPTLLETLEDQLKQYSDEKFDPKDVVDGRQRIFSAIVQRLGQQAFRRKLLGAYAVQCALTRCKTACVLEAAHITPYRGIKTNAVSNGLLLRADVHTLFDLALISIEPSQMRVRVSSRLAHSEYAGLDGSKPALPIEASAKPSAAALEEHYSNFHQ
jgi:hypothetical protein